MQPGTWSRMSKLAKELAPAFDKASWGDVEDDVSLCVWVRKECGEELTVKQAEMLRKAMEAEIAKFPKVVIFVEGGVVQGCTSNDPRLKIVLVDRDSLKEEEDPDKAEEEALEGTEDCVHDVF